MSSGPEIQKMLVISTAHVSEGTLKDIAVSRWTKRWAPHFVQGDVWVFYIGFVEEFVDAPSDLSKAVQYARSRGCLWMMLDRYAERIDDLATY